MPLGNISGTLFQFIFSFTGWEHCDRTTGNTAKYTVNEPLRNIMGTFFGKILGFPMDYLMGTLQSHDLEHCECTGHFLYWEHCNEIGLGNSECVCNVLDGFLVGTLSISS